MKTFSPGQRWISQMEPELGLGSVEKTEDSTVHFTFGAAKERRQYRSKNAPLVRVKFKTGDWYLMGAG